MSEIADLIGKTPTKITQTEDEILLSFSDGTQGKFYHCQDCCETVVVEDVSGDWHDLIGSPILVAEERVSDESSMNMVDDGSMDDSNTWTFYTLRGIGGSVDVRWHGSSNGYYSEHVDFCLTPSPLSDET